MMRKQSVWMKSAAALVVVLVAVVAQPAFAQGSGAKADEAAGSAAKAAEPAARGSAAKATTAEVLQMIKDKASSIKTVKATQTMTMAMMGQDVEMKGDIAFAAPDKFRMEMGMPGLPQAMSTVISDGKTMWIVMPQVGMVQKIDIAKAREALGDEFNPGGMGMNQGQSGADFSDPFSEFKEGSVDYAGTEVLNGTECVVFEAKPQVPEKMRGEMAQFVPKSVKLWLGKDDGMLRKQAFYSANGQKMMEMTYGDIKINPELPEGTFDYTPGPNAQVMDMTEMMINTTKGMMGGGEATEEEGSAMKHEGSAPKSPEGGMKSEMEDRGI